MCHFYANPLSVLHGNVDDLEDLSNELQPEHLEAIRMLPSFRTRVENLLEIDKLSLARDLIESDDILLENIATILQDHDKDISESLANGNIKTLLMSLTLLSTAATTLKTGSFEYSELYVKAFGGSLNDSDLVSRILDSVRVLTPFTAQTLLQQLDSNMASGIEEIGDNGGIIADMMEKAHSKLRSIANEIRALDNGTDNLRTKYSLQNKTLRTTVIAQKVQLSKAQSTLSKDDVAYTDIIDILVELLASLRHNHAMRQSAHSACRMTISAAHAVEHLRKVFRGHSHQLRSCISFTLRRED
jgi:origin recognition complex subunit 3